MTHAVSSAPSASPATSQKTGGAPAASGALSSDFDTFLKMLTVQLQNQDPLNPIDSTDYAVQLATFSSVEQAVLTNDLLENLSAKLGLLGFSQLSGWVGMEARSEAAAWFDGSPILLKADREGSANVARLVVRDATGEVVQTLDMEPADTVIEWTGVDGEGRAFKTGLYSFELENYYGDDYLSTTPVETYSRIIEARADDGEIVLVLEGGNEISSHDVTALRDPD
ncbi:flagellar hook capping FlgD N-terminal domain-containing protein [Celeribacter indicus]|uniref:Basal-body rod modification protein FlgD n=1 Tax=Celeribacter indicus TaxID=1208324 RepID=A0A0B5E078_9RHOB|nr:flagellar hook capping FlgD N-terminal domain-containing protein [Celeribacter indicus]AJE49098.1 flagellar basal body rod modification protein [Celeribacter indicus]SDX55442.1 flagellar basal-body rod modification protein FlgD [Celeribacter indicus]